MACRGKLADQRCRFASPGEHPVGGVADRTDRAGAGGLAGFGFPFVTLGTAQLRGHQFLRRDEIAARCDYPTGAWTVKKTRPPVRWQHGGKRDDDPSPSRHRATTTFSLGSFSPEGAHLTRSPYQTFTPGAT